MKAITCSQCGALIKRVRIRDKYAECDYCHATIPVIKEKVIEIGAKQISRSKPQMPPKNFIDIDLFEVEPESVYTGWKLIFMSMLLFGGLIAAIGGVAFLLSTADFKPERSISEEIEATPEHQPTKIPTPPPSFSYRVNVKYPILLNADHIEIPTLDEEFPTYDIDELKKTIFKEKRIRVQIDINKDGEVTQAKALNGHEILRNNSETAAKKSLFAKRKTSTSATLTYIYLIQEKE